MESDRIEDQLALKYHGPQVQSGGMDSYEVANNIVGFSEFLRIASRKTYGDQVSIRTEVQGFKSGSFGIDFFFFVGAAAANLLVSTPLETKDFLALIKEAVKAWIHLDGKPPKSVQPSVDRSNMMDVENHKGDIYQFNADTINVVVDPAAGRAVEKFIKRPLENDLSSVEIRSYHEEEPVARIEKKDAPAFLPVPLERPVLDNEITLSLLIESPTFKEGNKWRFSDGTNSFYADIEDADFLTKVDAGEKFGKGESLLARVRFNQTGEIPGSLKMERTVVKVLEHKPAAVTGLLFPDPLKD